MDLNAYPGLPHLLRYQADRHPEAVAIVAGGEDVTYARLAADADRIAGALLATGVVPGDHVGLLARNSPTFLAALFGIMRAGAIATPLNWRLSPQELAWIVNDAAIALVLTDAPCAPLLTGDAAGRAPATVRIDEDDAFAAWLARGAGTVPDLSPDDETVVMQIYTSGTTGRPKGAMLCNRNFEKFAGLDTGRYPAWWSVHATDRAIIALPLFHVGGLEVALRILFAGATFVLLTEFDPAQVLATIARYRPTMVSLVPTMLHMVLTHPDCARTDLSSIGRVFYGASPITLALLLQANAAMPAAFVQAYGMTETTSTVAVLPPHVHTRDGTPQMRAAGLALPGVEIRIARPDGIAAAPMEVGEILVRGRVVMKGYWNDPAATAEAIDADGWLRSGDAGYMDADGFVYVHDRIKDMIISGGENIYPAEIENAMAGHAGIAEVAVVGVPDAKWGEAVVGVVTLAPCSTFDEAAIIAWTRARIAPYKVPRRIVAVAALPRNAAGKLLKAAIRRMVDPAAGS